jgi:hypothetical protein
MKLLACTQLNSVLVNELQSKYTRKKTDTKFWLERIKERGQLEDKLNIVA